MRAATEGDAPHAAHVSGSNCQANNDTLPRSPLFKVPVPSLRAKPQRPKSRILLSNKLAPSTIFKGKRHLAGGVDSRCPFPTSGSFRDLGDSALARQGNRRPSPAQVPAPSPGAELASAPGDAHSVDRREDLRGFRMLDGEFPQAVEVIGEDVIIGVTER